MTLLALGAALYVGSVQGIWWDEWSSIVYARMSNAELMDFLRKYESHPPLFFYLQKLMVHVLGETVLAIRVVPVVSGVLCVPLITMGALKSGINYRAALASGWLLALHPFHIHNSVDARMYSLVTLAAILSTMYIPGYFQQGLSGFRLHRQLFLYFLFTVMMMYVHYYGALIMAAHLIWALYRFMLKNRGPSVLIRIISVHFMVTVFFLPWAFYSNLMPWHEDFSRCITTWLPPTGIAEFLNYARFTVFGMMSPFDDLKGLIGLHILMAAMIFGLFISREKRRDLYLYLALAPTLGLFIASGITGLIFGAAIFQIHQTVLAMPFIAVVFAIALDSISNLLLTRFRCRFSFQLMVVILMMVSFAGLHGGKRVRLEKVADYIREHGDIGETVIAAPERISDMLAHFGELRVEPLVYGALSRRMAIFNDLDLRNFHRSSVWLAFRDMPHDEYGMEPRDRIAAEWFEENWIRTEEFHFDYVLGWSLYRYMKPEYAARVYPSIIDYCPESEVAEDMEAVSPVEVLVNYRGHRFVRGIEPDLVLYAEEGKALTPREAGIQRNVDENRNWVYTIHNVKPMQTYHFTVMWYLGGRLIPPEGINRIEYFRLKPGEEPMKIDYMVHRENSPVLQIIFWIIGVLRFIMSLSVGLALLACIRPIGEKG